MLLCMLNCVFNKSCNLSLPPTVWESTEDSEGLFLVKTALYLLSTKTANSCSVHPYFKPVHLYPLVMTSVELKTEYKRQIPLHSFCSDKPVYLHKWWAPYKEGVIITVQKCVYPLKQHRNCDDIYHCTIHPISYSYM